MKSSHKVVRFDYSKIDSREDMRYFGIHPKSGRLHIDTKRYKKILQADGVDEFLPNGLFINRNTPYFIPAVQFRADYKFNMFRDLINDLRVEWEEEYKPLFKYIKSPKDIYENFRLNGLMFTSCADDIDDIECEAMFTALRRQNRYEHIIQSLYCSFISKISIEIDRITLIVMLNLGYKSQDFKFRSFVEFSDSLLKDKQDKKIKELREYDAFDLLHKINNFLKHNTIKSYDDLRKIYPKNVATVENGLAKVRYENGMFAGEWLVLEENYIDELFDRLICFFKDYCIEYLRENVEDADWNYDDYFRHVFYEIKDLRVYWGLC